MTTALQGRHVYLVGVVLFAPFLYPAIGADKDFCVHQLKKGKFASSGSCKNSAVESVFSELQRKVNAAEHREVNTIPATTMRSTTKNELTTQKGSCFASYGGKCFKAIINPDQTVNVTRGGAVALCQNIGWKLATVYDKNHYELVAEYLRSIIPSAIAWNRAWVGLEYDPQRNQMYYSNGTEMPSNQIVWYPGYPSSQAQYTGVTISVKHSHGSSYQGLRNTDHAFNEVGALCES